MSVERKRELRDELARALREELAAAEASHRKTLEGVTHAEAKPENDKDTRALEQSYLARGQAGRVAELAAGLAEVEAMPLRAFRESDPVALGAIVAVEDEDERARVYFVAPYGGGAKVERGSVDVITPKSPLGRALLGKRTGDGAEVTVAGKLRQLSIGVVA